MCKPEKEIKERERIAKELKEEAIANDVFYRKLRKDYEEIDNETWLKLEKELMEGYKANAKLDLKICDDFKYVDSENI